MYQFNNLEKLRSPIETTERQKLEFDLVSYIKDQNILSQPFELPKIPRIFKIPDAIELQPNITV